MFDKEFRREIWKNYIIPICLGLVPILLWAFAYWEGVSGRVTTLEKKMALLVSEDLSLRPSLEAKIAVDKIEKIRSDQERMVEVLIELLKTPCYQNNS